MESNDKPTDKENKLDVSQISKWNVSKEKIKDMSDRFTTQDMDAKTEVSGDISNWKTPNLQDMTALFKPTEISGDISNWDISNVKDKITEIQEKFSNTDKKSDVKPKNKN